MPKASRKSLRMRSNSGKSFKEQSIRLRRGRYGNEKRDEGKRQAAERHKITTSTEEPVSECCLRIPETRLSEDDSTSEEEDRGRQLLRSDVTRGRSGAPSRKPSLTNRSTRDEAAITQEIIHNVIIHAVESEKIPFKVLEATHLTIGSITEFFKKYNAELMSQWKHDIEAQKSVCDDSAVAHQPQDIASHPFSILQVAFGWARSKLRSDMNKAEIKRKREDALTQIKRARDIYLLKKADGVTDAKDIMASVCDTLKVEPPTPTPESKASPINIKISRRPDQDALTQEERREEIQSEREYHASIYSRSLPPYDDASSQSPGTESWVPPFRKRGEPVDALAKLSPPLELPFPEQYGRRDSAVELSPGNSTKEETRSHHKRSAAKGDKGKQQSTLCCKPLHLSEAMAKASITDANPSRYRSASPEKKQKGTRGIARPIYKL
ncbi:hypothetical protein BKA64DRAFT_130335 [Cadophora sp. MPI-SDFR-AT-0126]|nr:hypothetical protein BKA64DRAFT_130335 [Leotiomycetes sp. MPI-SDFR-AT-0126]